MNPAAPCGCGRRIPAYATPARCWRCSSTTGRLRSRAWLAQLPPMDPFGAPLFQVTGQQLPVPATAGPWPALTRCSAAISRTHRTAGHVPGQLHEAGLSWRKSSTLRDLAERPTDGRLNQGALITALGPVDVVLPGGLALRKATQGAYQLGGQDFLLAGRNQEAARKLACGLGGHAERGCESRRRDRAGGRARQLHQNLPVLAGDDRDTAPGRPGGLRNGPKLAARR